MSGGVLLERESVVGHPPSVTSAAIDPRGRYLLTGGPLGARLWWAASGEPVRDMKRAMRGRAAFGAEGRLVVGAGPTASDVETGELVATAETTRPQDILAVDARGHRILTLGAELALWNVGTSFERVWSLALPHTRVEWAAEVDDDDAEDSDEHFDVVTSESLPRVHSAQFHAAGERIVIAGYVGYGPNAPVAELSAADGKVLRRFPVQPEIYSISVDQNGRVLLGVMADAKNRMLRRLDLATGAISANSAGTGGRSNGPWATAIRAVPETSLALVGTRDGELSLFDLDAGFSPLLTTKAHDGWISALAFLPDGRLVSTGGYDGQLCFWRLTIPQK